MIDVATNENDSGRSLLIKSEDDKLLKEHIQNSSTDAINNSQPTIKETSNVLEEFEKDERRMVATKLLERQG